MGEVGWSLYASEEYVARRDVTIGSASLFGHDVVGYESSMSGVAGAQWIERHLDGQPLVMACGDPSSAKAAVLAGLGVSVLPCIITAGEPRLRRLVPDVLARTEMFLVIPPDHRNTVRIRVTADHLVAYMAEHRALLTGEPTTTDADPA